MRSTLKTSSPCLLEPFMNVEITLPDGIVGEVLSDVSSSRGGHILGIKSLGARFSDEGGSFD
jgi:translation elongation factor EF-G